MNRLVLQFGNAVDVNQKRYHFVFPDDVLIFYILTITGWDMDFDKQ